MKPRFLSLTVGLLAVSLLSACASAPPSASAVILPSATFTAVVASPPAPDAATSTATHIPVQAVATSRGPNLEATDPNTVSLASGGLQLVEFFRFT